MAQTGLGVYYETGNGLPRDFSKAVEWHQKAPDQGYGPAKEAPENPAEK